MDGTVIHYDSRWNIRRRVDDYGFHRFGTVRWRRMRDEIVNHFNRHSGSPQHLTLEVDGEKYLFSRALIARLQKTVEESRDTVTVNETDHTVQATYPDELAQVVDGEFYFFADLWEPTTGKHKVVLPDGTRMTANYGRNGWSEEIAGFFAKEKEPIRRKPVDGFEYALRPSCLVPVREDAVGEPQCGEVATAV